jgi:hypothetical protein
MDAEVRFIDGETRSFGRATGIVARPGAVVIKRWWRTMAVIPMGSVRWARLVGRRKVSQRDFGTAAL